MWVGFSFPPVCMLGVTFSMDGITIRLKDHHADKIIMMYKAEGGGLQAYGIFQKGYTYQIFICNDPLSKTYLSKSMSPLGFRVVELLDTE